MRSILFVCTANICRSPMAVGVLRRALALGGKESAFHIDSAGTHEYQVGRPPSPLAVDAARNRGYDLSGILARRVGPGDFDRFDMILAMDKLNLAHLRTIAPTRAKRSIELLLEYGERFHGLEVPDPHGGPMETYDRVLDMIEDGCLGLAQLLIQAA